MSINQNRESGDIFLNLISESNEKVKFIENKIKDLISIKSSLSDSNKEDEEKLYKKFNNIVDDIEISKERMTEIIDSIKSDIEISKNKENDNDQRTKLNLFNAMIKKYQKVINKFQDIKSEINQIKENKLVREYEIVVGRDITKEEKNEIIENPQIILQKYEDRLKGKAPPKLINAVRDLEERHKDIKKLEKSLMELTKMISEFNKLVFYQGEMIDNIVENIGIAKDYIQKAEGILEKAKKCMKRKRCSKLIIILIVVGILLVIILPIISKFV
jgi:syntaxin 1B/2/3